MLVNPQPGSPKKPEQKTEQAISGLKHATQASILSRFLANIIAFLTLLLALGLVTYQIATGQTINPYALSVLSVGLGYVINLLSLNTGVILQPLTQPQTESPPQKLDGRE